MGWIATVWSTRSRSAQTGRGIHPDSHGARRVGPAWSSVIVIGGRLFTQEQRGEQEAVVCYDTLTGRSLWVHEEPVRFWEAVSGAGPRATPTFHDGRIYSLGGTGILNCLDAATGKRYWTHNIAEDAGAKIPQWGFSGSPLLVNGLVIVFAGGDAGRSLLAYRAETEEPAWTASAGVMSYSSCWSLRRTASWSSWPRTLASSESCAFAGAGRQDLEPSGSCPAEALYPQRGGNGLLRAAAAESCGEAVARK